eukprot:gene450-biopygen9081
MLIYDNLTFNMTTGVKKMALFDAYSVRDVDNIYIRLADPETLCESVNVEVSDPVNVGVDVTVEVEDTDLDVLSESA